MSGQRLLAAFTEAELAKVHILLASKVSSMFGRKFEEGDWADVYCAAKGIPETGWSNLNIDVMFNGLGVEHKMLSVPPDESILNYCGTSLMHPSATRSIRIPESEEDPTTAARDVLSQYAELINERRRKVSENAGGVVPDMRTGWLLWQTNLKEFLYFEEEMKAPNPDLYWAEWRESGGGSRKKSRNLWVYDGETGKKRYSITTTAGAKIQPYFDIPPPNSPHLYRFVVQGEVLADGNVRVWVSNQTATQLKRLIGELNAANLERAIAKAAAVERKQNLEDIPNIIKGVPLIISKQSYAKLYECFKGVSDHHNLEQLLQMLLDGD